MPLIDAKKQIEAREKLVSGCAGVLPSNRKLPLWTDLTNPKLADVWLLKNMAQSGGGFGNPGGSAFGDNLKGKDEYVQLTRDWYQGNFFKTKSGHTVYIADSKSPDCISALSNKLFGATAGVGKDYLQFHINRGDHDRLRGGGWGEKFTKRMFTMAGNQGPYNEFAFQKPIEQNGITFNNWFNLLSQLDTNTRIPTTMPILLTYNDGGIISFQTIANDINNFYKQYGTYITLALAGALTLVTAGSTAALVIGAAQKMLAGVQNLTNKIASGQTVNATDVMGATGGILPAGTEKYVQKALDAGEYLKNYQDPTSLLKAANIIGVSNKDITNIVGSVVGTKGSEGLSFLLDSVQSGQKLDETTLTLAVLKSQNIVSTTAINAQTLAMAKQFIDSKGGNNSALVQNVATNSLNEVMNGIIPNINNVSKVVIDNNKAKMSPEEYRSWINMATARNDLDTSLPQLAYQSMIQQAIESSNANKPYVLPVDIPDKYRTCMAYQIMADTGVPVIDSKTYKKDTGKGKNRGKKVKRLEYS
jgi:hypothetical protein